MDLTIYMEWYNKFQKKKSKFKIFKINTKNNFQEIDPKIDPNSIKLPSFTGYEADK